MSTQDIELLIESVNRGPQHLADKILSAFHQACDQEDVQVAERVLRVLETVGARSTRTPWDTDHRATENLVAARVRLRSLQGRRDDR